MLCKVRGASKRKKWKGGGQGSWLALQLPVLMTTGVVRPSGTGPSDGGISATRASLKYERVEGNSSQGQPGRYWYVTIANTLESSNL